MTRFQINVSGNRKTGPIPVSITTSDTCPDACPFKGAGCYAEGHWLGAYWRKLNDGRARSLDLEGFVDAIKAIAPGTLWRMNQAGDLPGENDRIDGEALARIAEANQGRRGFTYTHKPVGFASFDAVSNARAVDRANRAGLTINLSADNLAEADELSDLGIAPVVVVLPTNAPDKGNRTPAGRHVVVCPAQLRDEITCATCELCANGSRKSIVGFKAHGMSAKKVSLTVVQTRLPGIA